MFNKIWVGMLCILVAESLVKIVTAVTLCHHSLLIIRYNIIIIHVMHMYVLVPDLVKMKYEAMHSRQIQNFCQKIRIKSYGIMYTL